MTEKTFEGKTRADWLALRGKGGMLGCPEEKDINRALLWFEEDDKKTTAEREDRRFQVRLDESRRQSSASRRIAWLALAVAAGSVAVSIVALVLRPAPAPFPSIPSQQPLPTATSQTTNAAPSTLTNTTKP
jgi:hypothetical protein